MAHKVKIFMCTHKKTEFLPPLSVAVQGGARTKERIEGTLPDFGEGGDISDKNSEYCELTVQYYAWKNEQADTYGFCHYRRFFCFDERIKRPYLVFGRLPARKRHLLGTEERITRLASEYDVILPRAERMGLSVREKYLDTEYFYREDLDAFLSLLASHYPHLSAHAARYMEGHEQYFCNMFFMKREVFFDYCEHLFPLLSAFDAQKTLHGNFRADRTDGYLAERFLGIYLSYLREKGAHILEISRIDVDCPLSKRLNYHLFPPESRWRAFCKRLITARS